MITIKHLQEYRAFTYGFHPKTRVTDKAQAIQYVNKRGFIFFWPINGVVLPSLWGAYSGDRPVPNEHDDPGHVTWGWKDSLLGKHVWFYGKILRKKATIIAMDLAPYFYALTDNYGSPEEDYLTIYEQGLMTQEAKTVYESLLFNGPQDSISLRKSSHLTSRNSETRFVKALVDLQADFKIMPVGVVDAGTWHYSFAYDIVARHEPELIEKSRFLGELDAKGKLIEKYICSVGVAQARDIARLFGWKLTDVEQIIPLLVKKNVLADHQSLENMPGEWITWPELT